MKKDSNPLISILVPVYNCEPFLDECISSIINQDYPNLQIVLGNDGSTDGSHDILKKYAQIDPRIEIFSRENKGVATTRNDLLDRIKGDYFLFVDADDWIEPNMVSYLLGLIKNHNADMAVCSNVKNTVPKNQTEENIQIWDQKTAIKKFLFHKELSGSLCNKLICTRLLHKEPESSLSIKRFNPEIYYGEDALFIWSIIQEINKMVISNLSLYHYRMNPDSISHASFGEKKLTGDRTWNLICNDVDNNYPTLSVISHTRWGLENSYLLFQASQCNYRKDASIKNIQKRVRKEIKQILKIKYPSKKEKLFALILCYWYDFGFFYLKLHNIKNVFVKHFSN